MTYATILNKHPIKLPSLTHCELELSGAHKLCNDLCIPIENARVCKSFLFFLDIQHQ